MPGAAEIHVKGAKELDKAFRQLRKEVLAEVKPALLRLAEPVRMDAEQRAFGNISNIGDKWGRMRVGVTLKGVYVAPKTKNSGGDPRPNFSGLLMDEAMQPALEAHEGRIKSEMETLVMINAARSRFL